MIHFFKRRNEYLIKNKPERWFTQSHYYIWPLLLLLLVFVGIGFNLPISINVVSIFFFTIPIGLILFFLLGRYQYLYATRIFVTKKLHKIFWTNFIGILLITLLMVAIPIVVAKRAQHVLEQHNFSLDSDKIRIAMIKKSYVQLLKTGVLDIAYLDSVFKKSEEAYRMLESEIWNLDENKFVKNNLSEYNYSQNIEIDSEKVAAVDNTIPSIIIADSVELLENDTSSVMNNKPTFNDSTAESDKKIDYLLATLGSITYKWDDLRHSSFLTELKEMRYNQIDSIKKNIHSILQRYDLDIYQKRSFIYEGEEDSTNSSINKYYDRLNIQIRNLSAAIDFANALPVIVALVLMITICLSQLSLIVILQINAKEKVASFFTSLGLIGIFYIINSVSKNAFDIIILMWLLLNFSLLVAAWITWKKKYYSSLSTYFLLTFYFAMPFVCYTLVMMALTAIEKEWFFMGIDIWLILGLCTFLPAFIFCNYQFIKRFYILNNLPKQS